MNKKKIYVVAVSSMAALVLILYSYYRFTWGLDKNEIARITKHLPSKDGNQIKRFIEQKYHQGNDGRFLRYLHRICGEHWEFEDFEFGVLNENEYFVRIVHGNSITEGIHREILVFKPSDSGIKVISHGRVVY